MRIAVAGIAGLKVIALLSIAVPIPTPASAELSIVVPYTQWRAPGTHHRTRRVRTNAPAGDSYRDGPVQCAAASHLCGYKRIPRSDPWPRRD